MKDYRELKALDTRSRNWLQKLAT